MGDFVAVLLFCCIANIQLSQAPSNLGPLECGETVTGFFDLIRLFTNGVYYELSLTETTTFFGTFDTCKPGTNISTQIDFLSTSGSMDSLNPWMGIHYNHELPCSINSNYTIMYYNISPSWIADNGATFRVNLNSPQQANNDIGTYEVSLSCGPPTTPPSQSPSSEPTAPTTSPSASPSSAPSTSPSASPSSAPSTSPSASPSSAPTSPTLVPTICYNDADLLVPSVPIHHANAFRANNGNYQYENSANSHIMCDNDDDLCIIHCVDYEGCIASKVIIAEKDLSQVVIDCNASFSCTEVSVQITDSAIDSMFILCIVHRLHRH
eukprot:253689_1